MALLDIHVELALTNSLLARIADALDRAIPVAEIPDHSKHPLIGLGDISHFNPATERATMPTSPYRSAFRHAAYPISEADSEQGAQVQPGPPTVRKSTTGAWDHEDPLDPLEDLDQPWQNYVGVDR